MAGHTGMILSFLTLVSICLFDSVPTLILLTAVTLQYEPRTVRGKPPSARGYHVTTTIDSRLFVFGGVSRFPFHCAFLRSSDHPYAQFNGHDVFDDVHILDLAASAYLPLMSFHIDLEAHSG